ncbi:ABC transporter substrate-binding protein [Clostridium senegalense]|uniref:ABC transporter substrate-binding protein n=1 Tax=Clostridium senegalense TaxID=1465809 RepID=A0A6M0H4Z2_9CLOT|nr:ABC transporter substrate-binding protein [Clostridium senegalense]NEU05796.1 ABC transporter substrate-binding protein [Clostridium senegalense]
MNKSKKILLVLLSAMMSLVLLVGCSSKTTTMKDREGNEFTAPEKLEKIISTAPSNTEVLVGLGLGDKLVAVDTYSSDVEGIKKDITKIDFRNPDAEAIIALQPDIVIASGHNKEGNEDPFKVIKESGIPVVYLPSSDSVDGVYEDINFLAELTGTKEEGKKIVDDMKSEIDKIKKVGESITDKKKVYFEIGSASGLYSFGNNTFLNEMVQTVGGENIFVNENSWIAPSEENVISANPDVILTNEEYIPNAVEGILKRPGWENVNAVKNKQVYLINQNASSRGSQNIVKALKEMAKAIYPDKYEK